jgi:hypothetical protein
VQPPPQQLSGSSRGYSSSKPWLETAAGGVAAAANGDAGDMQRQLLDMEGSSSLWVTKQLAAEAAAAAAAGLDAGNGSSGSIAAAAAGASDAAGVNADAAAAAAEGTDAAAAVAAGHFQVVHTYDVEGVGWVVSGIAVSGERCHLMCTVFTRQLHHDHGVVHATIMWHFSRVACQ